MPRRALLAEEALPPAADINLVPLIDIMLVLVVVFLVTAPLLQQAVSVDLPRTPATATPQTAPAVLAVAADGQFSWNGTPLSADALADRLKEQAGQAPDREIHIQADRRTPYESVAAALALASRSGLRRLAFVSLPE